MSRHEHEDCPFCGDYEPRDFIFSEITIERERQDAKWGDQSENAFTVWSTVLTEETGEVAKAVLDFEYQHGGTIDDLRKELIQVAAVAVAWIEAIDANRMR